MKRGDTTNVVYCGEMLPAVVLGTLRFGRVHLWIPLARGVEVKCHKSKCYPNHVAKVCHGVLAEYYGDPPPSGGIVNTLKNL